jgi:hypothetical protein
LKPRSIIDRNEDAHDPGPRGVNCYFVEMEGAAAPGGEDKKFKLEPQRLLYSLQ